jgi:hypothetical protein
VTNYHKKCYIGMQFWLYSDRQLMQLRLSMEV